MGATVRRSPIISNIPSNTNYDFLNIVDFRGLEINDNPLAPNTNSASDILNLYVDINGTLTTRPRTERTTNLTINNKATFYYAYPLETGLLLHGSVLVDDVETNKLWLYNSPNLVEVNMNGLAISDSKLGIIQKEGKIYILDGELYAVIKSDNALYDVYNDTDTYIPTTHIGYYYPTNMVFNREEGDIAVTDNIVLKTNEQRNILTNKYKQAYIWNDAVDYASIAGNNPVTIEYEKNSINIYGDYNLKNASFCRINDYFLKREGSEILKWNSVNKTYDLLYTLNSNEFIKGFSNDLTFYATILNDGINDGHIKIYNSEGLVYTITATGSSHNFYHYLDEILITLDGRKVIYNKDDKTTFWDSSTSTNTDLYGFKLRNKTLTQDETIIYGYDYQNLKLIKITNFIDIKEKTHSIFSWTSQFQFSNVTDIFILPVQSLGGSGSIYLGSFETEGIQAIKRNDVNVSGKGNIFLNLNRDWIDIPVTSPWLLAGFNISAVYRYWIESKKGIDLFEVNSGISLSLGVPGDYYLYSDGNSSLLYEYSGDSINPRTNGKYIDLNINSEGRISITYTDSNYDSNYNFENYVRFQNNYWFYGDNNIVRYTEFNDPTYIPETNYDDFGEDIDRITGLNLAAYNVLIVYKKNKLWLVTPVELNGLKSYISTETKTNKGNVSIHAPITTPLNDLPIHICDDGIYTMTQISNVESSDRIVESISMNINAKFIPEIKSKIFTMKYRYWTYIIIPNRIKTNIFVLDDRKNAWFYWEIYDVITNMWVTNDVIYFSNKNWGIFKLVESDIKTELENIPDYEDVEYEDKSYYDHGKVEIIWKWVSQILPMKTINYPKQLLTTSFIVTDNEDKDKYGLSYKFRVYRKLASDTSNYDMSDKLNYIANVTKKTTITRFNFLQLELTNIPRDLDNNKLKLSGIAFKYRLLEGSV